MNVTLKYGSFIADIYHDARSHERHTQTRLFHCRYFTPMPQLTQDCDRVVIIGIPPTDGMDFMPMDVIKLFQMMMDIRISEDYCRSDIWVVDYANLTLRHVIKLTPSDLKKFVLCAIVSSSNIFSISNDSRT
jgi:hypothetical protein